MTNDERRLRRQALVTAAICVVASAVLLVCYMWSVRIAVSIKRLGLARKPWCF